MAKTTVDGGKAKFKIEDYWINLEGMATPVVMEEIYTAVHNTAGVFQEAAEAVSDMGKEFKYYSDVELTFEIGGQPNHERIEGMGKLRKLENALFATASPPYSRAIYGPLLVGGEKHPIYTVPGWDYYGLVQESLHQLQRMTDKEVAALAGAGSVKYGGILMQQTYARLVRELATRPLKREILPGIHRLDDGSYLVVGAAGRVRRKPSKMSVLRQRLPIRGMGAYRLNGDTAVFAQNHITMQWEGESLNSVINPKSNKDALIVIFEARAPSWFKDYCRTMRGIKRNLISEAYGLASYEQRSKVYAKIKDVRKDPDAWRMIYGSYGEGAISRGSELKALRLAIEKTKELIDREMGVTVILVSLDVPITEPQQPIFEAAKELYGTATRFYHIIKTLVPSGSPLLTYRRDMEDYIGEDLSLPENHAWRSSDKIVSAVLKQMMPPMCIHELSSGHWEAYRMGYISSSGTVKQFAEQLDIPYNRLLVQYKGKTRLVQPPSFIRMNGKLGMATTPIINQPGYIFKQAYNGKRVVRGEETVAVLKYDPVTLLAGPSFDRSIIM